MPLDGTVYELRPEQTLAVDCVFNYLGAEPTQYDKAGLPVQRNPVVAMPTGTGKSLVIGGVIVRALTWWPGTRVLMLTHVKELIVQNADKLTKLWPNAPVGLCSSQLRRYDTAHPIVYGGVGSVVNRVAMIGWRDLIIIDECHLLSPDEETEYQTIIAALRVINPFVRVIGLSATPYRQGLGMITDGGIFTETVCDMTTPEWFKWFIDNGRLSRLVVKPTQTQLDVSAVSVNKGEYNLKSLQKAVNVEGINRACLAECCRMAHDRVSWLIFTTGIEHAEACADILNEFGVPALAVHSKVNDRDARFAAHQRGDVRAIVGNNIFTTGYDWPPIDFIGMLRNTLSTSLWVQMLGRGTRPYLGHLPYFPSIKLNCLVADFARNRPALGPIDSPTLPRKKGNGTGPAPFCICPWCETYNHAKAVVCVACGGPIEHDSKLFKSSGSMEVMTIDAPVTEPDRIVMEWLNVSYMSCTVHHKAGVEARSLRVTFACGLNYINHYVHIERTAIAGKRARDWWRLFSGSEDVPTSSTEASRLFSTLRTPKRIYVHLNTKNPEVHNYEF